MTRDEFNLAMTHLKQAYGESRYPEVRCDLFFKKFSLLDFSQFEYGIKEIIAKEDRAPMVERIASELREELNRAWNDYYEKLKGDSDCYLCKNNGYVFHKQGYGWADVVTKCKCELGKMWPAFRDYPYNKSQGTNREAYSALPDKQFSTANKSFKSIADFSADYSKDLKPSDK